MQKQVNGATRPSRRHLTALHQKPLASAARAVNLTGRCCSQVFAASVVASVDSASHADLARGRGCGSLGASARTAIGVKLVGRWLCARTLDASLDVTDCATCACETRGGGCRVLAMGMVERPTGVTPAPRLPRPYLIGHAGSRPVWLAWNPRRDRKGTKDDDKQDAELGGAPATRARSGSRLKATIGSDRGPRTLERPANGFRRGQNGPVRSERSPLRLSDAILRLGVR
jgi:hypothetical protein